MNAKKKIASFIVLTLVISIMVILWNPGRSRSESSRDQFWTEKANNLEQYQVVVYGDSRTYKGFNTPHFEDQRFESVYNFGFSSGSMSLRMLEYIEGRIDFSAERPVLILGFSPYEFTEDSQKDEQFLQEVNRSETSKQIRKYKGKMLGNFDPISPSDVFNITHNVMTYHPGGFVEVQNLKFDTLAGLESYKKSLVDNPFVEDAFEIVFDFVARMRDKGVDVYGYRVPCMISMQNLEDEMTGFNEGEFMTGFTDAGGQWIRLDTRNYETYDGSHLTNASTIQLTDVLIEKIFM